MLVLAGERLYAEVLEKFDLDCPIFEKERKKDLTHSTMEVSMVTVYPQAWERSLLLLAYQAEQGSVALDSSAVSDRETLDRAYTYCEAITSIHSRTFSTATRLLLPQKRRAMRALYAFCRHCDDIVDCSASSRGETQAALAAWGQSVLSVQSPADDLVALAWADTRLHYHIPVQYAEQLLDGVGRDLYQKRYRTFEELAAYAYGVASTVGLMSMHIIGFAGEQAIPYAVELGVALQLTNILRDVAEDWNCGRLYLPLDELAAFGLTEEDLDRGEVNERWRAFLRFHIERNRRLYLEARPGISLLHRDGRFAVAAASDLYSAILTDIEAHDYDVFHRRAHVSAWGKLRRLPGTWWRTQEGRGG